MVRLRRYWLPATRGFGIGVTTFDRVAAWFLALSVLDRLPSGAELTGEVIEDVDVRTLDQQHVVPNMRPAVEVGVWFPMGGAASKPVLQAARSPAEARERFVYVQDDGSARELTPDEGKYLSTAFDPADGARPYIKHRYDALTPDGRQCGFLMRKQLPSHIVVPQP